MAESLLRNYPQTENAAGLPSYPSSDLSMLESTARQLCQTVNLGNGYVICRVLGKYITYVDINDVNITPQLCLNGFWESWITLAMRRVLRPGWFCADIGSNHGYYTLIMADAVGPTGRVLAVEPNPKLVNLLTLSLAANGLKHQVTVVQKAASDTEDKHVTLAIPRNHGINATIRRAPTEDEDRADVETVTLDRLTRDWPRIDLVKVDAEGSEDVIWRGMSRLVESNPDVIIITEFVCSRYTDPEGFLRQIQDAGFRLRYIDVDSTIRDVTEDNLLYSGADRIWMLYLHRMH